MAEKIASLYAEIGADTSGLEAGLAASKNEITDLQSALLGLTTSVNGLTDKMSAGGEETKKSTNAWTEFNSAISVVKQGAEMVKGAFDATIGATLEYADQVRGLSQSFSITAEEASKLIQVGDDLGISADTLKTAFRGMAQQGIAPSLESLKALGAQYQAIQDPAERAQFALKNFGRAGLELSPILLATSQAIDASAKSAEQAGQVMGGKAVADARAYEVAVDSLQDKVQGLTYKISSGLIPALNHVLGTINETSDNSLLLADAYRQGAVSIDYVNSKLTGYHHTAQLTADDIDYINQKLYLNQDAFDRAIPAVTSYSGAVQSAAAVNADAARWMGVASEALDKQATDAMHARDAQTELAAGLGGQIGQASQDYADTQAGLADDIAKTTAELDKYQKLQGQTVTVTKDATASQLDLTNAQFDAESAAIKVADAQKKLNENTDPEKARQLQGALLDAQVAAEGAAGKVEKLNGAMGSSNTVTLDYSGKIGDLQKNLGDLQAKADEAQAHMHELTNEFIFQQASAGLDAGAALDLARNLGLIDEQTYTTSKALDDLKDKYDKNKDGAIDAAEAADGYTGSVSNLAGVIAQLQDKHITVTVTTIQEQIAQNGVAASGTSGQVPGTNPDGTRKDFATGVSDFVVPQGYPSDSFRIGLSSGERVSVMPPGQEAPSSVQGGNTFIFNPSSELDVEAIAHRVAAIIGAY